MAVRQRFCHRKATVISSFLTHFKKTFHKKLDKRFCRVLIIQLLRSGGENFFGDNFVIRSSIHTPRTFTGLPADTLLRRGTAWDSGVCAGLECMSYQPKQNDMNHSEQKT